MLSVRNTEEQITALRNAEGKAPTQCRPQGHRSGLGWKVMEGGDEGGVGVRLGVVVGGGVGME